MQKPFISISTDFGPGSKGIGAMKAAILNVCPEAHIIDLCHENAPCNISEGAYNLEASAWLPIGIHVCVIDPEVGTTRKGIVIETNRGDFLVGPDNGVLLPATRFLGGVKRAHQISNEMFFQKPVSPVFHGRDVFAPVTAHLANSAAIEEFGTQLNENELVKAPYEEAKAMGRKIEAQVIYANRFGNISLNIMQKEMHKLFSIGEKIQLNFIKKKIFSTYARTFGGVGIGKEAVIDDDFGRIEIALNQASFAKKHSIKQGQKIVLAKTNK